MNMENDEVEACSSTSEISESFNIPQTSQSWRSQSCSDLTSTLQHKTYAQKIRKRRKPVRIIPKIQQNLLTTSTCDLPTPVQSDPKQDPHPMSTFQKRKITTIHEGVEFHSRGGLPISERQERLYNSETFGRKSSLSKSKAYNEKVAKLRAIVCRMRKMAVEKPEMLQDSLPDETIKLFKSIHIK